MYTMLFIYTFGGRLTSARGASELVVRAFVVIDASEQMSVNPELVQTRIVLVACVRLDFELDHSDRLVRIRVLRVEELKSVARLVVVAVVAEQDSILVRNVLFAFITLFELELILKYFLYYVEEIIKKKECFLRRR